jgi:hypothetical protein
VTGRFEVQETCGDKGNDPKTNDDGSDGEDKFAEASVFGVSGPSLPDPEDLSEETDDENNAADDNGKPSHDYPFYSTAAIIGKRCALRDERTRVRVKTEAKRPGRRGRIAAIVLLFLQHQDGSDHQGLSG